MSLNNVHRLDAWAIFSMSLALVLACASAVAAAESKNRPPNIIVFFTDDQGYNDIGCFGSKLIKTPNFDRMATQGAKFTRFYVQPVCGVSRAALLTGCYPIRIAEVGNRKVGHPVLHPKEITIAEVLKTVGYRTALVGKWHLAGGRKTQYKRELMPYGQGFDYFYGTPLHNGFTRTVTAKSFKTQLMRNDKIIDDFLDQSEMDMLTQNYTREAIKFIRQNKDKPFFLFLAHNMPHVPLGASPEFRGKSQGGLYGDVIEELDWSVGQIFKTLKEQNIDEHTLIVYTSDNGPWIEKHLAGTGGIDAYYGKADPLRGAKMMTWEGGLRVPTIMRWPGKIAAGKVCDQLATSMDLFPTFAKLAGAKMPDDRIIDGKDIWPLMSGQDGATTPHEAFYYYAFVHLQAVQSGKWKLVLPRPARPKWTSWSARMIDAVPNAQLFNLETDIGEARDVAAQNPQQVARIMKLVEKAREDLGDYDRIGKGARFFDEGKKRPRTLWTQSTARDANPESGQTNKTESGKPASGKPVTGHANVKAVYDKAEPVGNLRFDFESADLQGWRVVEGKFDLLLSDKTSLPKWTHKPFAKQGKFHLSTVQRKDGSPSDTMTGIIESPVFLLKGKTMSFLIGGGNDDSTYITLCTLDGEEHLKTGGAKGPTMRRVRWDVAKWTGQQVFLRIVDNKTRGWGHITFDDFSVEGQLDKEATEARFNKSK